VLRRLFARRPAGRSARPSARTQLRVEHLETRDNPTVDVLSIGPQEMASDRPFFLPISVTNTPSGTVSYQVNTNSTAVSAQVLTGRTVQFGVSNGAGVSGTITLQLFDNVAPKATQRIVDLINSGFYTGKTFFRIDDLFGDPDPRTNFIIQGGGANNTDNSSQPNLEEEFDKDFTFASNGLLAMAKTSLPDSSNSQFFITDLDRPLTDRVEFLNYHYTIFGQLTGGFDTFNAMKAAPRIHDPSDTQNPTSATLPSPAITITSATVLSSSPNRVIEFIPAAGGFTGTTSVMITTTDNDGSTNTTFSLTGKTDTNGNNPPFLNPVADTIQATAGQPTTITLTSFDREGDPVAYAVKDVNFTGDPPNLSFSIDQATGKVTVTPASSFSGLLQFKIGVRAASATDDPSNYAAQLVTLDVSPPPPPPPPAAAPIAAEGSAPGGEPRVIVKNADGTQRFSVLAFEPTFTGGVSVAVADVNGDGNPDVIAVPGFGGAPIVKVLDGTDGHVLFTQEVFEDTFRGGLSVAVADTRGLGYAQVLVGAGNTGGPRVTLLDVKQNRVLLNFFSSDDGARGGVSLAMAEVSPGKGQFIVTGGGPGNGPVVTVFDANTGKTLGSFLTGDANDRAGIRVRVGDTLNTATNTRPVFVAPYFAPGTAQEKEYDNILPFLNLG
jgi:cyclophilin family peptidyl-prolyl cis-trans isomerase